MAGGAFVFVQRHIFLYIQFSGVGAVIGTSGPFRWRFASGARRVR
jgi:hypothetical protein